jgi:hypothetical protein
MERFKENGIKSRNMILVEDENDMGASGNVLVIIVIV